MCIVSKHTHMPMSIGCYCLYWNFINFSKTTEVQVQLHAMLKLTKYVYNLFFYYNESIDSFFIQVKRLFSSLKFILQLICKRRKIYTISWNELLWNFNHNLCQSESVGLVSAFLKYVFPSNFSCFLFNLSSILKRSSFLNSNHLL